MSKPTEITRIFLDQIESTNQFAMQLIAKSTPIHGTVISTYFQSHGRGQIGRNWFSGEGDNLSFSVIIIPNAILPKDQFSLNMILSLAVKEALQLTIKEDVFIKWPNDIIIRDKKIAGLLIQTIIMGQKMKAAVCGVGLNVNQQIFPKELPNPISLYQIDNKKRNLINLETMIVEHFLKWYNKLELGQEKEIRQTYLHSLYKRGELIKFTTAQGKQFEGEIISVDDIGKLIVNVSGELQSFALHEIKMVF